ncbi:MAG: AMP-binding protein [Planctomycetes bacterium]|nr:AMP-binding protein [Planctomycetota bacterium]
MLVHQFLERAAARTPDKTALVCDGQRLSYAQVDALANRCANALRAHGVRRGDRVVIWCPNSIEAVVAIFGTLKAGGVFVMVNETTKPDRLAYVVKNSRARALLGQVRQAATLQQLRAEGVVDVAIATVAEGVAPPEGLLAWPALLAAASASPPPREGIDRDLACLIYTSGSTGDPKGVMSAHHNVVFAATSISTYLQNQAEDIVISALPLSFDYGLYQLLMVFLFGGTLVLERSFTYPAAFLERLAAERATGLPGVPTMWAMLLEMDLGQFDLSSLRYVTNTAAALPPSHIQRLRAAFPAVRVYSMYGLTETKRTLYMPPEHLDAHPGSVGIAIPGTEVWVEDDNGRRCGPNEVGELVVRGGHVMLGYWEAPEATALRFPPGPLPGERLCRSGDLFTCDEKGFHYFVGRRDDMLKSRGEKVAPKEVEAVLHELEGVVEAAVAGVPDPLLGQAICAYVVRRDPGLTEAAVLRHCRTRLEDFKVPKHVQFVDSLPKTTTGKVHRASLGAPRA